ncbi:MAG TPA: AAA family ATPase [Pyrinomonadaceae bacterium]|nr:AAA family ATPase [Pyrinomonadaceae bacterium]
MDLLEREQFFGELEALLESVATGSGRFVLISGEAGIGKTSLVERFTEKHKKQARVFWGACDALFTPRPLGPLYDIAPQTHSNLLTLLEEEAPQASILSAVLGEMERAQTPAIVVIEDVHWADEATLDLLKFLGRRINRVGSLLIVTYRDDEIGARHPLRLVLGDLPNRSVARLRLPPLSEVGVNTLATRAGRYIEDLYTVTGGNPFFVTEALASKESGVPVTVRDAVVSRAARLSPEARKVLELVSVVPAKTERWLLEDTINPDTSALEECISAGMLRWDGEIIAFRHELARLAIENSLALSHRQRLHILVLKALRTHRSESLLARIVHHAAQAGDTAAVLEFAPVAARQAAALSAHRESASHYQTALRYADQLAPEERASLLESLSYECYLTDQVEEALDARREVVKVCKELGDKLRLGDNLRWMSRLSWLGGHTREAVSYSVETVQLLESLPLGPELAMAYSNRAQLHMHAYEHEQAVLWGCRAIELAEKLNATEILIHALNNVGTAQSYADKEAGRLKLEESLRLALEHNYQDHASRAYVNLGYGALGDRNYALAGRYFELGIAYSKEHDLDSYQLYLTACRSRSLFEQGAWDSASDDAEFVLGHHRVLGIAKVTALAVLGHIRVRRGDPGSTRTLDEALELAVQTTEVQRLAPVASARAEFAWFNGDVETTIAEARSVLEKATGRDDPWLQGEFALWMWRAGVDFQSSARLAEPYVLQMTGDWRRAAAAWKQIGCPYEQAIALADGDDAAQLAALEILETLGAGPASERLRQTMRAAGVRRIPRGPRQSTRENPAGLTQRQLEVLALLAQGLSTVDIANRLFISAKTVDHHVSAILAKLEVHSRAEAVAAALQSNLINQNREPSKPK